MRATIVLFCVASAAAARTTYLLNVGWKFQLQSGAPPACENPNATYGRIAAAVRLDLVWRVYLLRVTCHVCHPNGSREF